MAGGDQGTGVDSWALTVFFCAFYQLVDVTLAHVPGCTGMQTACRAFLRSAYDVLVFPALGIDHLRLFVGVVAENARCDLGAFVAGSTLRCFDPCRFIVRGRSGCRCSW